MSENFLPLIEKVRAISKKLRKTKAEKILRKYSSLKMTLYCPTRWNSLGDMLKHFISNVQKNAIQKACLDLGIKFDFTAEDIGMIKEIADIIYEATEIITKLSDNKANLNTADLVVSAAILKLNSNQNALSKNFAKCIQRRFLERRRNASDVLAYNH